MWGYPPWMYPPTYGSPQQQMALPQQDPVKLAKAWKKFLKEEKKMEKKDEPKSKTWTAWEVGLFLTFIGPFVGIVYMYAFLAMAEHIAQMMHP